MKKYIILSILIFISSVAFGQRIKIGQQLQKAPGADYIVCTDSSGEQFYLHKSQLMSSINDTDTRIDTVELVSNNLVFTIVNVVPTGSTIESFQVPLSQYLDNTDNQGISLTDNNDGSVTINLEDGGNVDIDVCALVSNHCDVSLVNNLDGTYTLTDVSGDEYDFGYSLFQVNDTTFQLLDNIGTVINTVTIDPNDTNTQNTISSINGTLVITTSNNPDGTINYDLAVIDEDAFLTDVTQITDGNGVTTYTWTVTDQDGDTSTGTFTSSDVQNTVSSTDGSIDITTSINADGGTNYDISFTETVVNVCDSLGFNLDELRSNGQYILSICGADYNFGYEIDTDGNDGDSLCLYNHFGSVAGCFPNPAAIDGSETIVTAGSNVTVTGTGTNGDPYIVSSTDTDTQLTCAEVLACLDIQVVGDLTITGSGSTADPYIVGYNHVPSDGSETIVNTSGDLTITGSGTVADPYIVNYSHVPSDGSETIVNAGTNTTVTGTGTTVDPYVISSTGMQLTCAEVLACLDIQVTGDLTISGSGSVADPYIVGYSHVPSDGSETVVNASGDIVVTGTGTTIDPYIVSYTHVPSDGSETIVTAGTNTTITGTGTIADPYIVSSTDTNTQLTCAEVLACLDIQVSGDLAITGDGSVGNPYIISYTDVDIPADGSETIVNGVGDITITGTGTISDPYLVSVVHPTDIDTVYNVIDGGDGIDIVRAVNGADVDFTVSIVESEIDLFDIDTTGLKTLISDCIPEDIDTNVNAVNLTVIGTGLQVEVTNDAGQSFTDDIVLDWNGNAIDTTGMKQWLINCLPSQSAGFDIQTIYQGDSTLFIHTEIASDGTIHVDSTWDTNTQTLTQTFVRNDSIFYLDEAGVENFVHELSSVPESGDFVIDANGDLIHTNSIDGVTQTVILRNCKTDDLVYANDGGIGDHSCDLDFRFGHVSASRTFVAGGTVGGQLSTLGSNFSALFGETHNAMSNWSLINGNNNSITASDFSYAGGNNADINDSPWTLNHSRNTDIIGRSLNVGANASIASMNGNVNGCDLTFDTGFNNTSNQIASSVTWGNDNISGDFGADGAFNSTMVGGGNNNYVSSTSVLAGKSNMGQNIARSLGAGNQSQWGMNGATTIVSSLLLGTGLTLDGPSATGTGNSQYNIINGNNSTLRISNTLALVSDSDIQNANALNIGANHDVISSAQGGLFTMGNGIFSRGEKNYNFGYQGASASTSRNEGLFTYYLQSTLATAGSLPASGITGIDAGVQYSGVFAGTNSHVTASYSAAIGGQGIEANQESTVFLPQLVLESGSQGSIGYQPTPTSSADASGVNGQIMVRDVAGTLYFFYKDATLGWVRSALTTF